VLVLRDPLAVERRVVLVPLVTRFRALVLRPRAADDEARPLLRAAGPLRGDLLPPRAPPDVPPRDPRAPASRDTNLKNRLVFPPAVLSWYRNARFFSSNFSKKSSQSIASSSSRPAPRPGKSMRRIPASLPRFVPRTLTGTPSRVSIHRRITP
jgi:hypothetical protein